MLELVKWPLVSLGALVALNHQILKVISAAKGWGA